MLFELDMEQIKYDEKGLVPAIIQDAATNQVLMLAYMNSESLRLSLETGETYFYSRSRQELWHKGATSGHTQSIQEVAYDCDGDTILLKVKQAGVACHTGATTCFFSQVPKVAAQQDDLEAGGEETAEDKVQLGEVLEQVFQVIKERQAQRPEGSYTTYLFEKGQDKILKKVAEETGEVIIGSKNNDLSEVSYEVSDLFYHVMVLLAYHNLTLNDIAKELDKRR